VRRERPQLAEELVLVAVLGLEEVQPLRERHLLHRTLVQLLAPTRGPVRLRHDRHHPVIRREQLLERRHREPRGPEEDDVHMTLVSIMGFPSLKRDSRRQERSSELRPVRSSSASSCPLAGACITPWPLNPPATP